MLYSLYQDLSLAIMGQRFEPWRVLSANITIRIQPPHSYLQQSWSQKFFKLEFTVQFMLIMKRGKLAQKSKNTLFFLSKISFFFFFLLLSFLLQSFGPGAQLIYLNLWILKSINCNDWTLGSVSLWQQLDIGFSYFIAIIEQ